MTFTAQLQVETFIRSEEYEKKGKAKKEQGYRHIENVLEKTKRKTK